MRLDRQILLLLGMALVATLCAPAAGSQAPAANTLTECAIEGDVRILCGLDTPEDLLRVPGTPWVIASSVRGVGVHAVDLHDRSTFRLFPGQAGPLRLDRKRFPGCPGPLGQDELETFATHGLALRRAGPGRFTLYAVHHTHRESVEVFDLDMRGTMPTASWVGCVLAPKGVNLNSLVTLADGGVIASNFLPGDRKVELPLVMAGKVNGELWEWHRRGGWSKVPGSEASGANGIEISADERWIYFNAWGTKSFVRLSRGMPRLRRTDVPVGFRVDNVHWAPDGTLLEAGQTEAGYRVAKIDPRSLRIIELLDRPNSGNFSLGTVAMQFGAQYWIGSAGAHAVAVFYDGR